MRNKHLVCIFSVCAATLFATGTTAKGTQPAAGITSTYDGKRLIADWIEMWNDYDLNKVEKLFVADETVTYFSSEKQGLIKGIAALIKHHEGFGFKRGGKKTGNRLWVEDTRETPLDCGGIVTGIWYFQKDKGKVQRGPVTFVYTRKGDNFRLIHVHFANY